MITPIQQTTSGPWFDINGVGGTLAPYQGGGMQALVVRQTYGIHREIEQLLYGLRQARSPEVQRRLVDPGAAGGEQLLPPEEPPPAVGASP